MDAFALPTFELSLSASGLRDADGRDLDIRATLEFARSAEYHAIQLNAADPLTRPRELSRSARRDLAAHIRRHELACSGVDLWIPKAHFSDETKIDRVVGALCDAVEFAADIADLTGGQRLLSIAVPWQAGGAVLAEVAGRAASIGVTVANHAYPWPEDLSADGPVRVGIDPATIILASADPAQAVSVRSRVFRTRRTRRGFARYARVSRRRRDEHADHPAHHRRSWLAVQHGGWWTIGHREGPRPGSRPSTVRVEDRAISDRLRGYYLTNYAIQA